ncbi:hypothetical protein EBR21_09125, partial [bacterium]|nr:hypothetical protein [bacterium]
VSGPLTLLVVSVFEFVATRYLNLPRIAGAIGVALLSSIIPFFYWIIMTWSGGMTVGKRIIGIQVVPGQFPNAKLGAFRVFFRETLGRGLILILSPLTLFGFFATDFIARTRVVRVRNPDSEI